MKIILCIFFLPQERSSMRVYVFLFSCDRIDPVVLECHERAHFNGNEISSALFK